MDLIKIWLGILMRKVLKRGSFISTDNLKSKFLEFIDHHNKFYAHPYHWKFSNKVLKTQTKLRQLKSECASLSYSQGVHQVHLLDIPLCYAN